MNRAVNVAAAVHALRVFAAERPETSRCGLCGASMAPHPHHAHLLAAQGGRIVCACAACALLFGSDESAPYRCLPTDVRELADARLSESDWQSLGVPIRLAFFVPKAGRAVECVYPSPAGPVRSPLDPESAAALALAWPGFRDLRADVEALFSCDLGPRRATYRLPIDECFRLVGLVRRHWRGASGGAAWWSTFDAWLAELSEKSGGGFDA